MMGKQIVGFIKILNCEKINTKKRFIFCGTFCNRDKLTFSESAHKYGFVDTHHVQFQRKRKKQPIIVVLFG
jgi:hypothetical protein